MQQLITLFTLCLWLSFFVVIGVLFALTYMQNDKRDNRVTKRSRNKTNRYD